MREKLVIKTRKSIGYGGATPKHRSIKGLFKIGCAILVLFMFPINCSKDYYLISGQSPTNLTVTNNSKDKVYANLVLGLPPSILPQGCANLGTWIQSISDPNLVFQSSIPSKTVTFIGPPSVYSKGAYEMDAGETIAYIPQTFPCFTGKTCVPSLSFNFFFTAGFNGTLTGNNGCGGTGTTYPNATNLAEGSINFSANGAVGSNSGPTCANSDDTDISAVSGVNAIISINTQNAGTGAAWPSQTSVAQNGPLGTNFNIPGVFAWAATNCINSQGHPNPSSTPQCDAPIDAPQPLNGSCQAPTTLIKTAGFPNYCAQTSSAATCNNQRAPYNTGGTIKITYKGQIPPTTIR